MPSVPLPSGRSLASKLRLLAIASWASAVAAVAVDAATQHRNGILLVAAVLALALGWTLILVAPRARRAVEDGG